MNDNDIIEELEAIKKLLIVGLQNSGVKGTTIAKALGITPGRLSQIISIKEYKKRNEKEKN
jgi:predicted transcriptional regulator